MTKQQHPAPVTPPPELVEQWEREWLNTDMSRPFTEWITDRAAQWGADQELEACCEFLDARHASFVSRDLRAARRPKPPSLKAWALAALSAMSIEPCVINGVDTNVSVRAKYDIIRRALEQLPDD